MVFVCHEKLFPGGFPGGRPTGKQLISALDSVESTESSPSCSINLLQERVLIDFISLMSQKLTISMHKY